MGKMLRIEAPHFVAGVELNDYGEVCNAAPIVRYMWNADWTEGRVRDYCKQKGWTVSEEDSR